MWEFFVYKFISECCKQCGINNGCGFDLDEMCYEYFFFVSLRRVFYIVCEQGGVIINGVLQFIYFILKLGKQWFYYYVCYVLIDYRLVM